MEVVMFFSSTNRGLVLFKEQPNKNLSVLAEISGKRGEDSLEIVD